MELIQCSMAKAYGGWGYKITIYEYVKVINAMEKGIDGVWYIEV